jgi:hypothetical protein
VSLTVLLQQSLMNQLHGLQAGGSTLAHTQTELILRLTDCLCFVDVSFWFCSNAADTDVRYWPPELQDEADAANGTGPETPHSELFRNTMAGLKALLEVAKQRRAQQKYDFGLLCSVQCVSYGT